MVDYAAIHDKIVEVPGRQMDPIHQAICHTMAMLYLHVLEEDMWRILYCMIQSKISDGSLDLART
jgi:hypothetical protein